MVDSHKSLEGKRIVVTRAVEQSESLVAELRTNGATAVLLPMVSFAPPEDSSALDEVLRSLTSFRWIFLTSQNALRALQDRCAFLGLSLPELTAGVRIAAVGPATAEAAQQAGLQIAYVALKHQGVALARELADEVRGHKVLLPRSDRASQDLVDVLTGLEADVTEVVAYRTLSPNEAEIRSFVAEVDRGADAILFFSPSAVHHLRDILGAARFVILSRHAAFTAIGPVTEKAVRGTGVERVISAKDTHVAAVIGALIEFFSFEKALQAGAKRG
ncbi:MAG: uroporphyrinogen-III synthase [Candidatus Acidiferrum sp.]